MNAIQGVFVGFAICLTGYLIKHFLDIDRDKRKEFNEIASPVQTSLQMQLDNLISGKFAAADISKADLIAIELCISKFNIKRFRKAVSEYKDAQQKCGHLDHGRFVVDDLSEYIKATYGLLHYIKTR